MKKKTTQSFCVCQFQVWCLHSLTLHWSEVNFMLIVFKHKALLQYKLNIINHGPEDTTWISVSSQEPRISGGRWKLFVIFVFVFIVLYSLCLCCCVAPLAHVYGKYGKTLTSLTPPYSVCAYFKSYGCNSVIVVCCWILHLFIVWIVFMCHFGAFCRLICGMVSLILLKTVGWSLVSYFNDVTSFDGEFATNSLVI